MSKHYHHLPGKRERPMQTMASVHATVINSASKDDWNAVLDTMQTMTSHSDQDIDRHNAEEDAAMSTTATIQIPRIGELAEWYELGYTSYMHSLVKGYTTPEQATIDLDAEPRPTPEAASYVDGARRAVLDYLAATREEA